MIVPITDEAEWHRVLATLPAFTVPAKRIVLLSPHPDDETLGAGAYLASVAARGTPIVIAAATDGENAYADVAGQAAVRRGEQADALAVLGIRAESIRRFGLTDSGLAARQQELEALLAPLVTAETLLMAPWTGDYHPDHRACGEAAQRVATQTGATLIWYFFWTWHRGTPADLAGLDLRVFRFDEALAARKLRALECHGSQLHRSGSDPILPDSLLGPARRRYEVFAQA